jgi:hypothetical protein
MMSQYPNLPQPSIEDLIVANRSDSPNMKAARLAMDAARHRPDGSLEDDGHLNNLNWFLADHLAAIVIEWGKPIWLDITLGLILEDRSPLLFESDNANEESIILWIHHNMVDHYSGVRRATHSDSLISR